MSNEVEEIFCSNCNIKCDQSLMLRCNHNLCMNCASENLIRNESEGINKSQYIICDICQTKTEIDTNTSKEILSFGLINSKKNNNNIDININNNKDIENNPRFYTSYNNSNNNNNINNISPSENLIYFNTNIIDKENNNFNNIYSKYDINEIKSNLNLINNKTICQEHNEPITYLCLDCMSKCICTECVVHGVHRNHEVLNIKKAYPLIYNKTQEISNIICSRIKELNLTQKNIEQKKREINNLNSKCKIDIRQAFDELRNLLNKKEKEIINKTENTLNDNFNELNTYYQIINSKIILLNRLNETVNAYLMRKDELNLINFYTENKNKILAQTELNEINNINNLNLQEMSNLKIDIDKNSFDAMISAINTLNFEINSFKGIDIGNKYNLGKFTANRNLYGNNSLKDENENLKEEINKNKKNLKNKNKK